jgi:cobalt-zinc-cadmium efflux system outer membrane protein
LRRQEALAQLRGAWRNVHRLTQSARSFAGKTKDASAQLVRSAEASYRGGEIGVLELLDAYRSGRDDKLRRLDLEVEARRARIVLDATVGGGPNR